MKISWLGHSCFLLESGGERVVIDPYRDVPGYPALHVAAHRVLTSHDHFDHNCREAVAVMPAQPAVFDVTTMATFHDDAQGAKRGGNTVHLLSAEAMRVVHLGDLGHMLTEAQLSRVRGCDVLMVPVGGFYTLPPEDAASLCRRIGPRILLPMHYREGGHGFKEIAEAGAFCELIGQECPLVRAATGTVEITPQTARQTILLTYPV